VTDLTELTAQVTAALERSVRPSVIARGGAVRAVGVREGILTLEVTGSPGAVFPLAARIEALICAAVPEISAVRLAPPSASAPGSLPAAAADLAGAAREVLDAEVNPAIAAHRGHVSVDGAAEGWIRIRLHGGCQGCSLAEVTIRQGIEPLLQARLPGIIGITDVTDHAAGTDPFFSAGKR